ncbi:type II secretion system F family protein [Desulfotruncus alcoholivorax]|uniref:type II secretion system F family protein n=1 Tax=Desulfotruncus alcoholivorax TaxID=265477 RepID=UPI0004852E0E|nr:type II secretion system F family protein [Desulfotruncus alcoholivorax]
MTRIYDYRARNHQGRIVRGSIGAESAGAAASLLRNKRLFALEVTPGQQKSLGVNLLAPGVGAKELAPFCRQFAAMIGSGVPILQCLDILARQNDNKTLVQAVKGMAAMLEKGRSLAEAARLYPGVFPRIFASMLEAGEISGTLDRVLERLAEHFEKEHDLREKVKSAMTYPATVLAAAVLAVAALLVFVLPSFTAMLAGNNLELPAATRLVLKASVDVRHYWYLFAGTVVAFGLACKKLSATSKGRLVTDNLLMRLPVFGALIKRIIIARFARTLALLLSSGVPLLQSFDVVKKVVANSIVERAIAKAADCVQRGEGIAQPLQQSGVFPPMVTSMISIGEETGALDAMLEKLAVYYEREVEDKVARLSSVIEPVLIVVLGGVVGFIVIAIMLPMFSAISSIE